MWGSLSRVACSGARSIITERNVEQNFVTFLFFLFRKLHPSWQSVTLHTHFIKASDSISINFDYYWCENQSTRFLYDATLIFYRLPFGCCMILFCYLSNLYNKDRNKCPVCKIAPCSFRFGIQKLKIFSFSSRLPFKNSAALILWFWYENELNWQYRITLLIHDNQNKILN